MKINVETRFNVGDIVKLKGAPCAALVGGGDWRPCRLNGPIYRYLVAEILTVTCAAGTQTLYSVLPVNLDGRADALLKVHETLLEASAPFVAEDASSKTAKENA